MNQPTPTDQPEEFRIINYTIKMVELNGMYRWQVYWWNNLVVAGQSNHRATAYAEALRALETYSAKWSTHRNR